MAKKSEVAMTDIPCEIETGEHQVVAADAAPHPPAPLSVPVEVEDMADGTSAVQGQRYVLNIPLEMIVPSPYQPRRHFGAEALEELAASIAAHGLLQPITVRPAPGADVDGAVAPLRYELIAGERRWRAAQAVGLATIPALLVHVDDREAALLALEENRRRADLNPIETALQYQLLLGMGVTQMELAGKIERSQPAIANALRLLELPEMVRTAIAEGRLSASHGRALCRWGRHPQVVETLAAWAVEMTIPVSTLEKGIAANAAQWLRERKAAVDLDPWALGGCNRLRWETLCAGCEDYVDICGYRPICLRPSCIAEKLKVARAEVAARREVTLDEQRTELAEGEVLREDLAEQWWSWILGGDGCPDDCAERRMVVLSSGRREPICLNPTRQEEEREARRAHKVDAVQRAIEAQLGPVLPAVREERNWPRALAMLLATFCVERAATEDIAAALAGCGLAGLVDANQLGNTHDDLAVARLLAQSELFPLLLFTGELLVRHFAVEDPDEEEQALLTFLAGDDVAAAAGDDEADGTSAVPGDAAVVALADECCMERADIYRGCIWVGCQHHNAYGREEADPLRWQDLCACSPDHARAINDAKAARNAVQQAQLNTVDALAAAKAALPAPPEMPGDAPEQCPACGLIDCECAGDDAGAEVE